MVFVPRLAAAAARRRLVHLTSHPRPFSTRHTQGTLTATMSEHSWATFFAGLTGGYLVAMYLERTKFKHEFVHDERHKVPTATIVPSSPAAK